ncbi:XRE family transcriptional regulator [Dehalococcoides mccartyi IBARAKI]|nr:XRE family transcriptional regulator [Dehalococcoides mccartyi IBARAKI]
MDKFWSQAELAKQAGIGADTVNRLENGKQNPSFITIRKLAKALEVKPEEIEF